MKQVGKVYVALLRGINVGGHVKIAMSELRRLFAELGMRDVRSVLQSGNLVFSTDERATADLERLFESETDKRFGLSVRYFVRTATEWELLVSENPAPQVAEADPAHFLVLLLEDARSAADVGALQKAVAGPERLYPGTRCAYVTYPEGIGRSRVTNAWLEKGLATRGTARNWNTVLKLAALASENNSR